MFGVNGKIWAQYVQNRRIPAKSHVPPQIENLSYAAAIVYLADAYSRISSGSSVKNTGRLLKNLEIGVQISLLNRANEEKTSEYTWE